MNTIYHYAADNGGLLGAGVADANPLEPNFPLLPAYATPSAPLEALAHECARYLDEAGAVPAHHADGDWVLQPDWRGVALWSTQTGAPVEITTPNLTPAQQGATEVPYPGPGYVWRNGQWQADPILQHALAEQAAEREMGIRKTEAIAEINRIQPAVAEGYAKPADAAALPQWQRYLYELPDVRSQPGWPEQPAWLLRPGDPATE